MSDTYELVEVHSRAEWREWLRTNHTTSPGIWLVTFKKASGGPYIPYGDVVEEALCFGWVDSVPRKLDAERSQLLMTPRKPSSRWSKVNKDRVDRLIASGHMTEAGQRSIDTAIANGLWVALDDVDALIEPDDLSELLDARPEARRHWEAFPPSARRGILEWILSAKRAETRARRIAETVESAAIDVRANQWPRPNGRGT